MKKRLAQKYFTTSHKRFWVFQIVVGLLFSMGITICKLSEVHADSVDIAVETFRTKSWSLGTGWSDAWYYEGSADIVSSGKPRSGSYHMRLRSADAWTDRPLNLSGYDNARLGVYVKVKSFEDADFAELMIKSDDNEWEILRRFTPSDSDNQYHYYEFD